MIYVIYTSIYISILISISIYINIDGVPLFASFSGQQALYCLG